MAPLKRVRFFTGQLLSAQDFQTEQEYLLTKRRLHNRMLHGWGVVAGLKVSSDDDGIAVSEGLAINCMGEEIVVPEKQLVPCPATRDVAFLVIEYFETKCDPVHVAGRAGNAIEHSRIEEGFRVSLVDKDPCVNHKRKSCGGAHPLTLAKLVRRKNGWRVDRRYRPSRAKR